MHGNLFSTAAGVALAGCACGPIFHLAGGHDAGAGRHGACRECRWISDRLGSSRLSLLPGAIGLAATTWGIEAIGRLCVLFSLVLAGFCESSVRMSESRAAAAAQGH
jgi:hypothetical protein